MEGIEHQRIGRDYCGLHTIASRKVLRGNDGDFIASVGEDKYHFGVIIGKISMLDDAGEKRPEFECFLRGFEIKNKMDRVHASTFFDEEKATQELLGNGEGGLPDGRPPNLFEDPLKHIGHLQYVGEIALRGSR